MDLLAPTGAVPMRRTATDGAVGMPAGTWQFTPPGGGEPVQVQFTAGGCYRLAGVLRRDRGRWSASRDRVRVTMANGSSRTLTGRVRGDSLELALPGRSTERFACAEPLASPLPADRRCTAPGG